MDLALIQQDVKACNFWEFLEIELLLVSSYSYAWRRYTCLGSFWSSTTGCHSHGAAVLCWEEKGEIKLI